MNEQEATAFVIREIAKHHSRGDIVMALTGESLITRKLPFRPRPSWTNTAVAPAILLNPQVVLNLGPRSARRCPSVA